MMCSKSYEKKNEKFEIGNQKRIHRKKEIEINLKVQNQEGEDKV